VEFCSSATISRAQVDNKPSRDWKMAMHRFVQLPALFYIVALPERQAEEEGYVHDGLVEGL